MSTTKPKLALQILNKLTDKPRNKAAAMVDLPKPAMAQSKIAAAQSIAEERAMSTEEKLDELTKMGDISICCARCLVDVHDRSKGEYYLLHIISTAKKIWYSRHEGCRRDIIVAKDHNADKWNRIRTPQADPGPSGLYSMCEYCIDESDYVIEKQLCPSGESCPFAHTERECLIWSEMFALKLKFIDLKKAILDDVVEYEKAMWEAWAQVRQLTDSASSGSAPTASLNQTAAFVSPIPADAVRPGARYKSPSIQFQDGEKITLKVRVTKFNGVDHFYFQIRDNISVMEDCWRNMNAFYNSQIGERYKMESDDLQRNLPVAMRFQAKRSNQYYWRRGEIITYLIAQEVIEACDVDFGGVHYFKMEDLRFLSNQFFGHEKQVVEASLAYASPMFSYCAVWTKEATDMAKEFVSKESLNAEVVGIAGMPEHVKLAVRLADETSYPEGVVDLYRLLIKKRHASSFRKAPVTPFGPAPVPLSMFQKQVRIGRLPKDRFPKSKKETESDDY